MCIRDRYKGKVHGWDVVNEGLNTKGAGFRTDTIWYETIGLKYIEKAFEYAHEADPDAILFYNDFNIERDLEKANNLAGSDIGNRSGIEIIHGDYQDKELLAEIEISSHDIAISALDDDHASIAAALLASDMGVERTGLIMYDADLVDVVRRMGITFSVDRKRVAIDTILARIHSELPGPYAVLSSVPDVIGICLPVNDNVKFAGKTLKEASLPEWCKVAFIQRRNIHDEWETLRPSPSKTCLLYTSPSPRDKRQSRMPSSA